MSSVLFRFYYYSSNFFLNFANLEKKRNAENRRNWIISENHLVLVERYFFTDHKILNISRASELFFFHTMKIRPEKPQKICFLYHLRFVDGKNYIFKILYFLFVCLQSKYQQVQHKSCHFCLFFPIVYLLFCEKC